MLNARTNWQVRKNDLAIPIAWLVGYSFFQFVHSMVQQQYAPNTVDPHGLHASQEGDFMEEGIYDMHDTTYARTYMSILFRNVFAKVKMG